MAWKPDYATATELAEYVTGITDGVDADAAQLAVTAASRAIDRDTNRQFGVEAAAVERFYTARYDRDRRRWLVPIDDLMTTEDLVVTVVVTGADIDIFDLKPSNAAADGVPWEFLVVDPQSAALPNCDEDGVSVTALFGWTAVPDTIKQATLLQASRLVTRRHAPFGVAGSPESGSEMRLLAKLDPDVSVTVGPYRRQWGAV